MGEGRLPGAGIATSITPVNLQDDLWLEKAKVEKEEETFATARCLKAPIW